MWHRFKNNVEVATIGPCGHWDAINTLWWDNGVLPEGLMAWPRNFEVTRDEATVFEVRMDNGDLYRIEHEPTPLPSVAPRPHACAEG